MANEDDAILWQLLTPATDLTKETFERLIAREHRWLYRIDPNRKELNQLLAIELLELTAAADGKPITVDEARKAIQRASYRVKTLLRQDVKSRGRINFEKLSTYLEPESNEDPVDNAIERELKERLESAKVNLMSQLSGSDLQLLALMLEGVRPADIARILSISVHSCYAKARRFTKILLDAISLG